MIPTPAGFLAVMLSRDVPAGLLLMVAGAPLGLVLEVLATAAGRAAAPGRGPRS